MHIIRFNAMKALGNVQNALNYAELGSFALNKHFLAFKRFFQQKQRKCAKTRYFAVITRFSEIIGFNAMKALGNV